MFTISLSWARIAQFGFYMLLALALKHNFKTSKHRQLIGWFNQNFIKPGTIDTKYGKMINHAFENRSDSDYGVFVEFSKEEVEEMQKEMKHFIDELKNHIWNIQRSAPVGMVKNNQLPNYNKLREANAVK